VPDTTKIEAVIAAYLRENPAAQGPKGDKGDPGEPGKDGVVPVTGAAVGQTVKITAVDENGVPTAWEAADMPSGGNSLLVVTFTTDAAGTLTPSHTFAQIKGHTDNGGSAVLTDGKNWYNLAFTNVAQIWFERTATNASGATYVRYVITALGNVDKVESNSKFINVTAEVGQTIAVEEVDANGKPTKWTAVDFPSDSHINDLINTALGVIENGTY